MDFKRFLPGVAVVLSLAILIGCVFIGFNKGLALSRSIVTFENAKQLKIAVNYFYNDNNRYPTVSEFSDGAVMNSYLKNFPSQLPASAACAQGFAYKQISPNSYQLNFCLDSGTQGYGKGWNGVVESK